MSENDWQCRAARLFCYLVYAALAYICIKYFLPVLLPLCVGLCIAWAVFSLSAKINKKIGLPCKLCAFLLVTLMLVGIGAAVFFIFKALIVEARRMAQSIAVGEFALLEDMLGELPVLYRLAQSTETVSEELAPLISHALTSLASHLGTLLGSIIKATPSAFIGGIMTILFIYYASMEFDRIERGIRAILPESIHKRLSGVRKSAFHIAMGYLRAYAIIFVITFGELFLGLLILCPAYALLGALFISAVDILPVFGAGFVLIPWGIVSILSGEMFVGIGLLLLYLTVTVVRQIAEPRILGGSVGVHPLLTLTGMFIGYRALGFTGMIIAPIAIFAIGALIQNKSDGKTAVNADTLTCDK